MKMHRLRSSDSSPHSQYSVIIAHRLSSPFKQRSLTSDLVLRYFNMVSQSCLPVGPCLMQKLDIRKLRKKKEKSALQIRLEKFHQHTYGRKVRAHTDHRPLEIIAKKDLARAPKCLQRMLLQMQRCEVDIQYRPGKEMYLADTLSHLDISKRMSTC